MDDLSPRGVWRTIRRARLLRVLAVYLSAAFIVLQVVGLFTDKLGLPDWFFPGSVALLLIGLPIIVATALVQSSPAASNGHNGDPAAADELPSWAVDVGNHHADSGARELEDVVVRGADAADPADRRVTAADVASVARDWLTWRKSILGGALAFLLLAAAVSGYTAMRSLGIGPIGSLVAAGVLEKRERIILADFQTRTGDGELAAVVTEAFRVDISQSSMVTLVEPSLVQGALARMGRGPDDRLEPGLARELAVREGIKAVITGEVGSVGQGFVLSVRLLESETGAELAAFRETANDSGELLRAIDRLSKRVRERIGESLRSIRANDPLEQVTTASLDALSKYTQAVRLLEREGDSPRGIRLLEEAIALDPEFAMAYRRLGVVLQNRGEEPERARQMIRRAYELRHRLTEDERYLSTAVYHSYITGDRARAIEAYRNLLELQPNNGVALNNLGVEYSNRGEYDLAEEFYRRAIEADSFSAFPAGNIIFAQFNQGRFEEARASYEALERRFPSHRNVMRVQAAFAYADGDYDQTIQRFREILDANRDDPAEQVFALNALTAVAAVLGRLSEADEYAAEAARVGERRRGDVARLLGALMPAWIDLLYRGEPQRALARAEAALADFPLSGIDPRERPYGLLASFYAMAGRPDRARAYLTALEEVRTADPDFVAEEPLWGLETLIALAEDRPADAVRLIRGAEPTGCPICGLAPLGQAYEMLGKPDSAIVAYEAFLETPFFVRPVQDQIWRAISLERLAELHANRGDRDRAAMYFSALLDQWKDADPELQPRVRAAEAALARLAREGPLR